MLVGIYKSRISDDKHLILWQQPDAVRLALGHRPISFITVNDELLVTDGLQGGSWSATKRSQVAAANQRVQFFLSHKLTLPTQGFHGGIIEHAQAVMVRAGNGGPILIHAVGRLCNRYPFNSSTNKGGYGFIRAKGQDASLMRVHVVAAALQGPDDIPHANTVRPVLQQAVLFTARPAANPMHGAEAQAVWAIDGGPVQEMPAIEPESDDDMVDL